MISAATAAVAVLVVPLVREHGVEYLFAATILMGIIQIIAGLLRLDLVMQFVSRSVITGFVNALAILIFTAQLPQLTNVTWEAYAMVAGGLAIIYLRSEEHTSELQSLMRISYAVFCLKKKKYNRTNDNNHNLLLIQLSTVVTEQ